MRRAANREQVGGGIGYRHYLLSAARPGNGAALGVSKSRPCRAVRTWYQAGVGRGAHPERTAKSWTPPGENRRFAHAIATASAHASYS
jgi:hypothetical protein